MGNAQQELANQRNNQPQKQPQQQQQTVNPNKGSIVDFTQPPTQPTQNKKISSLLDDDDDVPPAKTQQPIFQQPVQQQPFDILGLDIGGGSAPASRPAANTGGDLLGGFSFTGQPNPVVTQTVNKSNSQGGGGFGSLLDDGFLGGTQPQVSVPPPVQTTQPSLGFDFLGTGTTTTTVPNNNFIQPTVQNNSNLMGFDLTNQQQQQSQQQSQQNQQNGFKFKAYETPHVEIWMEGKKEGDGNTKITAVFMNKTMSYIEQLSLQTAVMKYLKIAIQPMTGTSLPPSSKGAVTQVMTVTNSAVGQKNIVMKIKLSYTINGQKESHEEKLEGFPNGF